MIPFPLGKTLAKSSITSQIEQQIRDAGLEQAPDWFFRYVAKQCRIGWSESKWSGIRPRRNYTVAVLYRIWREVDSGRLPPVNKAIAQWLNDEGITTQQGNVWTRATVAVVVSQYGLTSDIDRYRNPVNLSWRLFLSQ